MVDVSHHLLECGCVVESVTDTLVGRNLEGNEVVLLLCSVEEGNLLGIHLTVGKEEGKMTEVVEVVIDCGNTERSHGRNDHRAVEWADLLQRLGKEAKVINESKKTDGRSQHKAGKVCQHSDYGFKVAVLVLRLDNRLLELLIYVVNVVSGVELNLDTGVGGFKGHVLLDCHKTLKVVSVIDLLTCDEAVDSRSLRNNSNVCGKKNVEHTHVGIALFLLLCEVELCVVNIYFCFKLVLRICSYLHEVGLKFVHRGYCSYEAAVVSVAESLLARLVGRGIILDNTGVLFIADNLLYDGLFGFVFKHFAHWINTPFHLFAADILT